MRPFPAQSLLGLSRNPCGREPLGILFEGTRVHRHQRRNASGASPRTVLNAAASAKALDLDLKNDYRFYPTERKTIRNLSSSAVILVLVPLVLVLVLGAR